MIIDCTLSRVLSTKMVNIQVLCHSTLTNHRKVTLQIAAKTIRKVSQWQMQSASLLILLLFAFYPALVVIIGCLDISRIYHTFKTFPSVMDQVLCFLVDHMCRVISFGCTFCYSWKFELLAVELCWLGAFCWNNSWHWGMRNVSWIFQFNIIYLIANDAANVNFCYGNLYNLRPFNTWCHLERNKLQWTRTNGYLLWNWQSCWGNIAFISSTSECNSVADKPSQLHIEVPLWLVVISSSRKWKELNFSQTKRVEMHQI